MGNIFDTLADKLDEFKEKKGGNSKGGNKNVQDLVNITYDERPFLKDIKPKRRYVFHSDYFQIDGKYCTILTYTHPEGQNDRFGAFWGVNRVVVNLPDGVSAISFENIMRYTEGWISQHQSKTEGIVNMNANENAQNGGTSSAKLKIGAMGQELITIAQEIQQGAAYLGITYRMLLKADSLELLDKTVENLQQTYIERFGTLNAGAFDACQREELSMLIKHPSKQRGRMYSMTSVEAAGSYNLVTKGLDDKHGEYVGTMTDDVNNAAILFDVNNYDHHVVIANNEFDNTPTRNPVTGYWCAKLAQSTLMHNGRVVHLIFDSTDLDELGPKFKNITRKLNLSKGDINMFEMFGDPDTDDELSIFSEQLQKIALMFEQVHPLTPEQRGTTLGVLKEIIEKYYVDQKMWFKNAQENLNQVRIIGLPHKQYPRLAMFVSYIGMEHKAANAADVPDRQRIEALGILKIAFNEMLDADGDLFNVITNSQIDDVVYSKRVIYDFSDLMIRGNGLAMAQFVNIVSYAVRSLRKGDTVIIHGAENICDEVKEYVNRQFEALHRRGGRVVYAYDSIDKAFNDNVFCKFDQANYTIFGPFTPVQVDLYQQIINQKIPTSLVRNLTKKGALRTFIRRNGTNVLFNMDLILGIENIAGRFR